MYIIIYLSCYTMNSLSKSEIYSVGKYKNTSDSDRKQHGEHTILLRLVHFNYQFLFCQGKTK